MHSAVALAAAIRRGEMTATQAVQSALDRLALVNPRINAAVCVLADQALALAEQADRFPGPRGPLHGVPFSVKDSIEVAGTVCTAGTVGLQHAVSRQDAVLVQRLRVAGAIPIAKTNLPDLLFAFESDNFLFGRTNHPLDPDRTAGGSSGGEAALIAAGVSPMGLGSDAAGSVRLPAHYCGIFGLKPTSGRLVRAGHVPPPGGWIESLWQIGPLARTAADLEVMMTVLAGPHPHDRTVPPLGYATSLEDGLRVAFFTDNGIMAPAPEIAAAVRQAAVVLAGRGHRVEEFRPAPVSRAYDLEMRLLGTDGGDGILNLHRAYGSPVPHPLLLGWIEKLRPLRTDLAGFAALWAELDEYRAGMHEALARFDVLLSPVAALPAVPHGHSVRDDVFPGYSYTMTHNLTGWPACSVPFGRTAAGLPVGVQVAAGPFREDRVLQIARDLT